MGADRIRLVAFAATLLWAAAAGAQPQPPTAPGTAPTAVTAPGTAPPAVTAPPGAPGGAPTEAPAPTPVPAPDIDVTVTVEPATVPLGEVLHYRATFRAPSGYQVFFPDDAALAPFQRVPGGLKTTTRPEGDETVVEVDMALRAYRLGLRKVPAIEVPVLAPGGVTGAVRLDPQRVRVQSRLVTEDDPQLAAPGEPVPVLARNWGLIWTLVVLGSVLLAAALTVLAIWLLRGRMLRPVPPPPPRPPEEVALEKLDAVASERLPEAGALMDYYVRVSEAVREYLGGRWDFDGLAMSTPELMRTLVGCDLRDVPPSRVQSFLEESDLVKFASFDPSQQEIEWLLDTAYTIVRDTTPEPTAPESETEEAEAAPSVVAARPSLRAFAFALDVAALAVPTGAFLAFGRVLSSPGAFVAAGTIFLAGLLLRDLPLHGSLGKTLLGLRLTREHGQPLGLRHRLRRNVLALLPVVGWTVEFIVMTFDLDYRHLGDRFGDTTVIDTRPGRTRLHALVGCAVAGTVAVALGGVLPFVVL